MTFLRRREPWCMKLSLLLFLFDDNKVKMARKSGKTSGQYYQEALVSLVDGNIEYYRGAWVSSVEDKTPRQSCNGSICSGCIYLYPLNRSYCTCFLSVIALYDISSKKTWYYCSICTAVYCISYVIILIYNSAGIISVQC